MKLFFFLSKIYLKNFLIILFALTFSATLIDALQHFDSIEGFNRKVLYFFYIFEDFLFFVYPLALVFGAISSFYQLITKNYLIAIYSFGYYPLAVLKPFIAISLGVYFLFIGLDFTNFAYANANAKAILSKSNKIDRLNDLFFKYNNSFVYVKALDSVEKRFYEGTLYYSKLFNNKKRLDSLIHFKSAKFQNNYWVAREVEVKKIKYNKAGAPVGYDKSFQKSLKILEGYYPKVIKLLYEGKRLSIYDGFRALKLLNRQNISNTKIVAALYNKIVMPLFAPFLIILIFLNLPIHKRFLNKAKFIIYSIGVTLITWAILYSFNMLSLNGAINPHFGQPVVILLLGLITLFMLIKRKRDANRL
ncbi:MAG: LptF/LptG family permease [Epsilonproteobacteria bacterium]|nr:LptF/LptG family permease [Campylobacterota bacterium]